MKSTAIVNAIAIDLGAKNTGVANYIYPQGTPIESFVDDSIVTKTFFTAQIASLNQGGYQVLQVNRTQKRHQLRCKSRMKRAKELLHVILHRCFQFPTHKHQDVISQLMNRRGFNYIDAQVDHVGLANLTNDDFNNFFELFPASSDVITVLQQGDIFEQINILAANQPEKLIQWDKEIANIRANNSKEKNKGTTKTLKALKPLAQAIGIIVKDITSGAKHRSKYFKEIKSQLEQMQFIDAKDKALRPQKRFYYALHDHKKKGRGSLNRIFFQLLCHINNLELKTLNAILTKINQHSSPEEIESVVAKEFIKWITKLWAPCEANGVLRNKQIKSLQQELRSYRANHPNIIFDFLINTDVSLTIAPYQSQTNRNTPKCQTLQLDSAYLTKHYHHWKQWLIQIQEITPIATSVQAYQQALSELISNKGKRLITDDEIQVRTLQRLFDASSQIDPFRLNRIWGILKKIKLLKRAQGEQSTAIEQWQGKLVTDLTESFLPYEIKNQLQSSGEYADDSFWHCLNKYFQQRRKAKEGRYFLHYDNKATGHNKRWNNENSLLKMCMHKPKQLKHQGLVDLLGLLGLNEQALIKKLEICPTLLTHECLTNKLEKIKGIKTLAANAYKAQKKYGIDYKEMINIDPELKRLAEKAHKYVKIMAEQLVSADKSADFVNRNNSLFQFAQLHQIVWGDRNGFSKACPVCTQDNLLRMTATGDGVVASRLFTLNMRLIDGGLKRILTHQAHHISNKIWPNIEKHLTEHCHVAIPLILEKNNFDFTAGLSELKGQKLIKIKDSAYQDKYERVVASSGGICPIMGTQLLAEQGQVDHNIPRQSKYGVLNDEANLVYLSEVGNQRKGNKFYSLSQLHDNYLALKFSTTDVAAITRQIENTIFDSQNNEFTFGRYKQFLALTPVQQTAFRHALYLADSHPLKKLVIGAITHRNKTLVNGTQRYMAQLIADIFIQKAKKLGKEKLLSFDYFRFRQINAMKIQRLISGTTSAALM